MKQATVSIYEDESKRATIVRIEYELPRTVELLLGPHLNRGNLVALTTRAINESLAPWIDGRYREAVAAMRNSQRRDCRP